MASKYFACVDPEGRGGAWTGGPDPPGKSQVAISFLRNTGMNPPQGRFVRPSIKYVDDSKNKPQKNKKNPLGPPENFLVLRMFWVVQIFWVNKLISVNCGYNESASKHQNLSTS